MRLGIHKQQMLNALLCLKNIVNWKLIFSDATREVTIGKTTKQENITSNDNPYFKSTRNDGHAETQGLLKFHPYFQFQVIILCEKKKYCGKV